MATLEPLTCSISDAARAVGLGPRKLYRLIEQGRLASVKVDRKRLVKVDSLRALVAANDQTPTAEPKQ